MIEFVKLLHNEPMLIGVASGSCGGFAAFLFAYIQNNYQGEKYIRKALGEIVGATITSLFLIPWVSGWIPESRRSLALAGFVIGVSWSAIIQMIRQKVTDSVKVALQRQTDTVK